MEIVAVGKKNVLAFYVVFVITCCGRHVCINTVDGGTCILYVSFTCNHAGTCTFILKFYMHFKF